MNDIEDLSRESRSDVSRVHVRRRSFLASMFALGGGFATAIIPKTLRAQISGASNLPATFDSSMTVWSNEPATDWLEAYPIGNGRLGAMVFGGVASDTLILNEDTLYAEEPGGRDLPLDITDAYADVVELLRQGRYRDADDIVSKEWLGRAQPCYQPLGSLHLTIGGQGEFSGYRRQLDLSNAVATTSYRREGVLYTHETFASFPDNIIVLRLRADKPSALRLHATLDSQHPTAAISQSGDREIVLHGKLPGIALHRTLEWVEGIGDQWKYPEFFRPEGNWGRRPGAQPILYGEDVENRGMLFEARLRVLRCDGTVAAKGDGLSIEGAQDVVLALAMASSFNGYKKSPSRDGADPASRTLRVLAAAANRTAEELRDRHTQDFRKLHSRVSLHIDDPFGACGRSTPERLKVFSGGRDPTLLALYFNFGRYLLISCSRPGTQAANLQGIWNVDRIPPWASAYTTNINIQMNYWAAETANLSECHEPLLDFIREMSEMGRAVARDMYHRPGWVMHHNTSIWRDAQPVDWHGYVAFWPMAGGWFCEHLWEHFRFTGDKAFLGETAYPILKGAAEFYDSWLVSDADGHLLTPVSDSPENLFIYIDSAGREQVGGMAMGCTLDMAIIRELFRNTIRAAKELDVDADWRQHLNQRIEKLLPYRVGSRGQLLEWFKDFKGVPPRHNTSPYFPLYPSDQITPRETPELAAAEQRLLEERARTGGAFIAAWMSAAWARLRQGNTAHEYLENLLRHGTHTNLMNGGGKIFQIDANLGAVAAVVEMLMQSHAGEIELLPALPDAWPNGAVKGLRARGGFEVDITWKDGRLTSTNVSSAFGSHCRIRYGESTVELHMKPKDRRTFGPSLV
jgi:alpha-L-fucosidase 2